MENNNSDKAKIEDFEQRLIRMEIILNTLSEKLDDLTNNYKSLPIDVIKLQEENKQQQKEIDELIQKDKDKTKAIWGIVASIAGGFALALIKFFVGI